jgi:3-hydroxyisobutyrate dehydrogenase
VNRSGMHFIDAPVSGGGKGAIQGSLTIMVGGTADEVATVSPILENLGRVIHTGGVGTGHALKAFNNLLSATHLWATSEVMEAGKRFGIDPEIMLQVFNQSSGRSGSTEQKWPSFILPGGFDSGFGLRLMLKDMRIATELSDQLGVWNALAIAATDEWQRAADELPADADHTEVAAWIAKNNGTA